MSRSLSLAWVLAPGTLFLMSLAAEPPHARFDDPPPAGKEVIVVRRCTLEYRYTTNLGAPITGILQDCLVELGARVKAGQVLGRLQDVEQQATIKVAEARYKLPVIRVKTAAPLLKYRAVAREEFETLKGQQEVEGAAIEAAVAAARIREIVSPFDGVVVGIFKAKGESVMPVQALRVTPELTGPGISSNSSDPIFRVVSLDWLRVTGYLDVVDAWRVQAGQAVCLTLESPGPDIPIKQKVFSGQVVFVDSEIDPKTRTCKVVADVDNRKGLLRAGLEVRMEIDPASAVVRGQGSGVRERQGATPVSSGHASKP